MMVLVTMLVGAALHFTPVRHRHPRVATTKAKAAMKVLRERRQAMLALRAQILHRYLIEVATERPVFQDGRSIDAGHSLGIGPTSVDVDFLGSPIVRTRVSNRSSGIVDVLVTVFLAASDGNAAAASVVVEHLRPGEARLIELACPAAMTPHTLRWQVLVL